jgi:aspartate aminotransferase
MSLYLLEVANVSTVTGDAFGSPNNIRISYAASDDNIKEAISKISDSLQKLS